MRIADFGLVKIGINSRQEVAALETRKVPSLLSISPES
jgi:hypothetical protein